MTSLFFETNYLQYANSDNYQSLANYIDGFKPTQRKIFYTYYYLSNKQTLKVAQLASKMAEETEYLSGENSASQVIVNMAKSFKGSNNIPYFLTKGHFGDRFYPNSASAPRYIFVKANPTINYIYIKDDFNVLIEQEFEGKKIEPRFFVPILPMILINGSEGIGNGFAQKILPRNPNNIKKYILQILNGETPDNKLLNPYYKNFTGKIVKENDKWVIYPNIKTKEVKRGYNYFMITDLPFNYDLPKFLSKLEEALEKKYIQNYIDKSENENFYFEIKTKLTIEEVINKLKLTQTISENFTCIDEENKIIEFNDINELINKYITIRLLFYKNRKNYLLNKWYKELEFLTDKIKFIKLVIENKLIINKRTKADILTDAKNLSINYIEDHLKMQIHSLTKEKIEELAKTIKSLKNKISDLENKSEKDLWIEELNSLPDI